MLTRERLRRLVVPPGKPRSFPSSMVGVRSADVHRGAHTPHAPAGRFRRGMRASAARRRGRAGGAVPRPPRARATSQPALTRRRCDVVGVLSATTAKCQDVPAGVSDRRWEPPYGGPIIAPSGRPSRFKSPDADEHGASTGAPDFRDAADRRVHRHGALRRGTSGFELWGRGVGDVDLLLDMPKDFLRLDRQRHARDARPVRVRARVREQYDAPRRTSWKPRSLRRRASPRSVSRRRGSRGRVSRASFWTPRDAPTRRDRGATALMHAVMGRPRRRALLTERGACVDGRASVVLPTAHLATVDPVAAAD